MAQSIAHDSLFTLLRRDAMHADDLEYVLRELKERLDALGVPFVLLGALAMRYYGYVRFTEDIDLLTTRAGLDLIHERLIGLGYLPRGPKLRKSLRHTGRNVSIDVITSGEHAGSQESPLVYPDPGSDAFVDEQGLRIPSLSTMITIKLVSGQWGNRPHDLGDVFRLIQANAVDESFAAALIPEVRAKFLELLDQSRQEVRLDE